MRRYAVMLAAQTAYQLRLYARSPRVVLYGALSPILLLVLLTAISDHRGEVGYVGRLTAGMVNLGLLGTCFTTLAASLVASRDAGVLKRLRATPLPTWAHLTGRVLATLVVALLQIAALIGLAVGVYGAERPGPAAALGIVLGGVTMSLVGLAVAQFIPRGDAAATLLSGVLLPVVLISGIFFPATDLPGWVATAADLLPVSHVGAVLEAGFGGAGPDAADLAWVAGWAVLGIAVALRWFRVEPAAPRRTGRRTPVV